MNRFGSSMKPLNTLVTALLAAAFVAGCGGGGSDGGVAVAQTTAGGQSAWERPACLLERPEALVRPAVMRFWQKLQSQPFQTP